MLVWFCKFFCVSLIYHCLISDTLDCHYGEFVDNIVYLLGLEINGTNVESLTELLNGLVGGSVYNSDIVITVRDALAGFVGSLETSTPAGAHILEILRTAELLTLRL